MQQFNIAEAKAHLSELVQKAMMGEEIVIAKAGKPLAKLVPLRAAAGRRPGRTKAATWIGDDFDAPLPEALAAAFEGRE